MTDAGIYLREDTVVALSTPSGRGAIAVLRLSGPDTRTLGERVFVSKKNPHGRPRQMVHGQLIDPASDDRVDDILYVWFPAPHSYTGEDMAEIHCHGSDAVIRKTLDVLYSLGARAAEPGEFTFRAVRSGKLDLAQAEAVGQLIDSRSQLARSMSLRMLEGKFSQDLEALKKSVLKAVVEMETQIEFPDDAMETELNQEVQQLCAQLVEQASTLRARAVREQRFEQGVIVVLAGRPNVGKSSLFNTLLGRERAIVTPHAGTTRDSLEGTIELAGWPVTLVDTAGLRETQEEIEAIGIQRTRDLMSGSQLVLFICEASTGLTDEDRHLLEELKAITPSSRMILVVNKVDLGMADTLLDELKTHVPNATVVQASTVSEHGVDELLNTLQAEVEAWAPPGADSAFIVSARQEAILNNICETLQRSLNHANEQAPFELMAEELYTVLRMIAELDGTGVTPNIMNTIFSQFCIGK